MEQFFVGKDTLVCDAYGVKSQKQFISTLCDNIKTRGEMDTIITDGGKYEISKKDVLVMNKTLYGTRSGEAYWHDRLFDILQQMDFKPSKADPDIWMRSSKDGTHYEFMWMTYLSV